MVSRREFTKAISGLIQDMIKDGEQPVLDYALRSAEEQNRLFKAGKSKLDGYEKISQHQKSLAADIYLTVGEINGFTARVEFTWDKNKSDKYHKLWEEKYHGSPIIIFSDGTRDDGHFQMA